MLIDDQSAVIAALSEQSAYGFKPSHRIIVTLLIIVHIRVFHKVCQPSIEIYFLSST